MHHLVPVGVAGFVLANGSMSSNRSDRIHRELTAGDIARIAAIYHAWRGEKDAGVTGPGLVVHRGVVPKPWTSSRGSGQRLHLSRARTASPPGS